MLKRIRLFYLRFKLWFYETAWGSVMRSSGMLKKMTLRDSELSEITRYHMEKIGKIRVEIDRLDG